MGTVSLSLPADGQTIDAADVNTPLNAIAAVINGGIDSTNITDGGIATADLAADAVTDAKLVYGKIRSRQGGSATNWSTTGTTTYDYSATNTFIQCGSKATSGDTTVTFPTAFNQVPLVIASTGAASAFNVFTIVTAVTATNFTYRQIDDTGTTRNETCNWIAIGE